MPDRTTSRREQAAATRTSILDAAERLFAEAGYDGTSTARIAVAAGVPKTLVFHYFPTKLDVLTAVLDERTGPHALDQLAPPRPDTDLVAALVSLDRDIRRHLHGSQRTTQILIRESSTQPVARRRFLALCARIDVLARATLDASLVGHVIPEERVVAAAQAFSAVVFRNLTLERLTGARQEVAEVARMVAGALRPSPAPDPAER